MAAPMRPVSTSALYAQRALAPYGGMGVYAELAGAPRPPAPPTASFSAPTLLASAGPRPFLTAAQSAELGAWLKSTPLLISDTNPWQVTQFCTVMQRPEINWDITAYVKAVAPGRGKWNEKLSGRSNSTSSYIKDALEAVAIVLEKLTERFIQKNLAYAAGTGENARIFLRIGEATALASFLLNDGSTFFFPSETDRATSFNPDKMLSYGFFSNNTVNNAEGIQFKTAFGKQGDLLGIESRKAKSGTRTNGQYYNLLCWCASNLYYLYKIIGDIDKLTGLTLRQKRGMLIHKLNTYLPGHIGLNNGKKLYSPRSIPAGAVSSLRLDLDPPKVATAGDIPKAVEASGWFSMLEYLVEDAVIPTGFLSTRDNRLAPLPTRGVPIEYRGAPAVRVARTEQAAFDQAEAEAEAAAVQEESDAFDQEQADKAAAAAAAAAARRTKMTIIGSVAAVAGAYYYHKHGGF